MGTPHAAVPSLEQLLIDGHDVIAVYTQPDRPSGRGNKIAHSPVKSFAIEHGIPVLQPERLRTEEAAELFRSHKAEVAVVAAYGRILPTAFLTAFPGGALNVHFSLLPKYRGAAPVNWAVACGETVTGVSIMQMDAGLDTGPVLLQKETVIGEMENAIELTQRLAVIGADALSSVLQDLANLKPHPQYHHLATLAPILKREDGLIDWSQGSKTISDRVRGFQPFPSSYTYLNGQRLTIWKASPGAIDTGTVLPPGTIIEAKKDVIQIACGSGSQLFIEELQIEGKRRMSALEAINGRALTAGKVFEIDPRI